jgi:hypothetical protein
MHENRIDGFREQRTEYRIADQKEKSGYCSTAKKNADIFLILFFHDHASLLFVWESLTSL